MGATGLRLRPLLPGDEEAFLAAHEAMAREDFAFGLGYQPGQPWSDYLAQLERQRCGIALPPGLVPATFLVAEVDRELVGRSSIRHELNDFLRREGGHIGYGVLPEHRRRGDATEMLRQSLVVARAVGVDRVLVTCDDDNIGSATVIERCGGVLHSVIGCEDGIPKRRYWID
jgi:predicted acetyltransferase